MKSKSRFKKYIDEHGFAKEQLPFLHTTSAHRFADLCDESELKPTHCKHFDKEILYLFYGRPAYRTENAEFSDLSFNWPIVFVLDPAKISDIVSVYPFDTGAFFLNLYRRFFSKNSIIEDFELPGTNNYASKLVDIYYNNTEEYLFGRSMKNLEIPPMNFEAEGIQKLAQEPSFTSRVSDDQITRDERSSAIEIQVGSAVDIRDATLAIILPNAYLELPEVKEALDRWGLAKEFVRYYHVIHFNDDSSWIGQIYSQVADLYKDLGFVKEEPN